jgi:hypothetical protein
MPYAPSGNNRIEKEKKEEYYDRHRKYTLHMQMEE